MDDQTLADAFDDEDDSDDEPDDRQRLVRGNSFPIQQNGGDSSNATYGENGGRPAQPTRQITELPRPTGSNGTGRIFGGGIQSDGVFSNLTAKPERGGEEKEEQPPVSSSQAFHLIECGRDPTDY